MRGSCKVLDMNTTDAQISTPTTTCPECGAEKPVMQYQYCTAFEARYTCPNGHAYTVRADA